MHFSTAAVLVLGALQPAFGTPSWRDEYDKKNDIQELWLSSREVNIKYQAPNPGCDDNQLYVGVWPADQSEPYAPIRAIATDVAERTKLGYVEVAKFNKIGWSDGEYKAVFFCWDTGKSWMVSENLKIEAPPPEKTGECRHYDSRKNATWIYTKCDKVKESCFDDAFGPGLTDRCTDCPRQCGFNEDE